MTQDELNNALKELQSVISKNQRLAREYNKNVRDAKKKQKELTATFNREGRERQKSEKDLKRKQYEALPAKQCAFVKASRQCCVIVRTGEFCKTHSDGAKICNDWFCLKGAHDKADYCIYHDTDYERKPDVRESAYRNSYNWVHKKTGEIYKSKS